MIECPVVRKPSIRWHYNLGTVFYRLLWGKHIHHGYWHADESPRIAQRQLTAMLAERAQIQGSERVLDVGCGMGASAIDLARRGCVITGLTLSPLQRYWASVASMCHRLGGRTSFHCLDAEKAEYSTEQFDVIWSIECTEHLFDKASFFRRAAVWLRPGGRVAICAWLCGDTEMDANRCNQVKRVCEAFLCPSLGTGADYVSWFRDADLVIDSWEDWTQSVMQTWEICERRIRRSGMRWLAHCVDRDTRNFLNSFGDILEAYRSGDMKYGVFVATKGDSLPGS